MSQLMLIPKTKLFQKMETRYDAGSLPIIAAFIFAT
jgi:hypothetical protein